MTGIHNIYRSKEYRIFERNYMSGMLQHQKDCLDEMIMEDCLTICMPTGTGKSRVIYGDMLDHLKLDTFDTFVIASHRLLLNVQHFNELFTTFEILATKIGFIFVGSSGVDLTDIQTNISINQKLASEKLNYPDLITTCLSSDDIKKYVDEHHAAKRDVIIITTYHSLDKLKDVDIHSIYCDEAHFLATPKEAAQFKDNFEKIQAKRKFFFTATPKDLVIPIDVIDENDTESFLMNNTNIFGKRIGISFKEAINECLIVKPYVHLMELRGFKDTKKYSSGSNYAKVILDGFRQHENTLEHVEECAGKILVKCPSVEFIWKIKKELENKKPEDIHIFAGASWNPDGNPYYMNNESVSGKTKFLRLLQELKPNEKCIILHYDILSEGIDVPGITGVMFLSKELPSKPKILQTIGRSTRLLKSDREAIRNGAISKTDYHKMIKPNCAVILPILSNEMKHSAENIAKIIISLRDQFGFKPEVYIEKGEDVSKGKRDTDLDGINDLDEVDQKFSGIGAVNHYIEILDETRMESLMFEELDMIHAKKNDNVVEYIDSVVEFFKNN